MAVARAKGKLRGKQPKLSARQQTHLVALHDAGAVSGNSGDTGNGGDAHALAIGWNHSMTGSTV